MEPGRFVRFLVQRGKGEAALLAAVSVSVLLAAAVVAGSPIYLRSLELLGIDRALDGLGVGGQHIQINTNSFTLDETLFEEASSQIEAVAERELGQFYVKQEMFARSAQHLWGDASRGVNTNVGASKAVFQSHTNIESHIGYLEGRHPGAGVLEDGGRPVIEAAVHTRRAELLGVNVGDVLVVSPDGIDAGEIEVRITGRFAERIEIDPFWLGLARPILQPPAFTAGDDLPLTLFVAEETLLGPVANELIGVPASVTWFVFTDGEALRLEHADDVISMVEEFGGDIAVELPRPVVTTGLGTALEEYRLRSLFTRVPMLLMAALALAASVYGLFMVAGIIADRRRREFAVLRSRGVTALQIARMYGTEAIAVIGAPVAVAPLLAMAAVAQLGKFDPYSELTGGKALPVELSAAHFGLSAVTGLAALALMAGPAFFRMRSNLAEENRVAARPDRRPFFQRYFIDAGVIALGFVIWFELRERGALVSAGLDSDQSTDITLLFAPALFLLAGVLALLRVFPYFAGLLSWAVGNAAPVWMSLGLWRIARSPYQSAWTLLLIALVAGSAIITGTLASTLERSERERIFYRTVSDVHVVAPTGGATTGRRVGEQLRQVAGVDHATSVLRGEGSVGTTGAGEVFEMFAVDPEEYAAMAWFRDDFAGASLDDLMGSITLPENPDPIVIPDEAESIGVWVKPEEPLHNAFLWAITRDERGFASTVSLGQIEGDEWQLLIADLLDVPTPAELISIQVAQTLGGDRATPNTVLFDDIEIRTVDRFGNTGITVAEDFESDRRWSGLPTSEGFDTRFDRIPELGPDGRGQVGSVTGVQVGRLSLGRGSDEGVRGMTPVGGNPAIPAIASGTFLGQNGMAVGDDFVGRIDTVYVPFRIVGSASYLPPLDPDRRGFVVADISGVRDFSDQKGIHALAEVEAIVELDDVLYDTGLSRVRTLFRNARAEERRQLLDDAITDPLVVAGWKGIAALAAAITVIAALIGYSGAQAAHAARTTKESAYILAMGLTRGHFLRMLAVEHVTVAAMGAGLGVLGGLSLSSVVVDAVAHTEEGARLVPPFTLVSSWVAFGIVVAALAVTFGLSLAARARRQSGPAYGSIARIGIRAAE